MRFPCLRKTMQTHRVDISVKQPDRLFRAQGRHEFDMKNNVSFAPEWIGYFAVCLMLLFTPACKYRIAFGSPFQQETSAKTSSLSFATDSFSVRLDRAKLEARPVFLDFYTSWCGPCKVMDRSVFTDPALVEYLSGNFVSLKVNAEKGEGVALAQNFEIKGYPTLVFLDASGVEKERALGLTTAKQLIKTGKRVQKPQ